MKTQHATFFAMIAVTLVAFMAVQSQLNAQEPDLNAKDLVKLLDLNQKDLSFSNLSREQKEALLQSDLDSGAYVNFFSLALSVDEKDAAYFEASLAKNRDLKVLFGWAHFRQAVGERLLKVAAGEPPKKEKEIQEWMALRWKILDTKLEVLDPEIAQMARTYSPELIAVIKKCLVDKSTEADEKMIAAVLGLQKLKEDGFGLILAAINNKDETVLATQMLPIFGENTLIPTIRYYENPDGEEYQKVLAFTIIKSLNYDNAGVRNKAVEALIHGPYRPQPPMPNTVEGVLAEPPAWCNFLIAELQGKPEVVQYIATEYLKKAEVTEKVGEAIELMCRIDIKTSLNYLQDLDCTQLSSGMKIALLAYYLSPREGDDAETINLKCDLFLKVFIDSSPADRDHMTAAFTSFPPEKMVRFYADNFAKLTKEEQDLVITMCDKRTFPRNLRDKVYGVILPLCQEDQAGIIKYRMSQK